jgi:hypothetical protein
MSSTTTSPTSPTSTPSLKRKHSAANQLLSSEQKMKDAIDDLKKTWKQQGISGILHIPGYGVLSLFNTELGRYNIIDQAQFEIKLDEVKRAEAALYVSQVTCNNSDTASTSAAKLSAADKHTLDSNGKKTATYIG